MNPPRNPDPESSRMISVWFLRFGFIVVIRQKSSRIWGHAPTFPARSVYPGILGVVSGIGRRWFPEQAPGLKAGASSRTPRRLRRIGNRSRRRLWSAGACSRLARAELAPPAPTSITPDTPARSRVFGSITGERLDRPEHQQSRRARAWPTLDPAIRSARRDPRRRAPGGRARGRGRPRIEESRRGRVPDRRTALRDGRTSGPQMGSIPTKRYSGTPARS